jgi:hypothetical protein
LFGPAGRETFESRDFLVADRRERRDARPNLFSVEEHRTGSALGEAAAELGTGKFEVALQDVKQRRVRRCLHLAFDAVDKDCGH